MASIGPASHIYHRWWLFIPETMRWLIIKGMTSEHGTVVTEDATIVDNQLVTDNGLPPPTMISAMTGAIGKQKTSTYGVDAVSRSEPSWPSHHRRRRRSSKHDDDRKPTKRQRHRQSWDSSDYDIFPPHRDNYHDGRPSSRVDKGSFGDDGRDGMTMSSKPTLVTLSVGRNGSEGRGGGWWGLGLGRRVMSLIPRRRNSKLLSEVAVKRLVNQTELDNGQTSGLWCVTAEGGQQSEHLSRSSAGDRTTNIPVTDRAMSFCARAGMTDTAMDDVSNTAPAVAQQTFELYKAATLTPRITESGRQPSLFKCECEQLLSLEEGMAIMQCAAAKKQGTTTSSSIPTSKSTDSFASMPQLNGQTASTIREKEEFSDFCGKANIIAYGTSNNELMTSYS